jgi:head-tail adaptor
VKVLSGLFRGKFLFYLKEAYRGGKLKFVGEIRSLGDTRKFQMMMDELYRQEWVTYCQPPFRSAPYVIEYLGRYTHRVAISNNRMVKIEQGKVTFRWRDYKDGHKNKQMTLEAFLVYSAVSIAYFTEQLCQNQTLWAAQQPQSKDQAQAMSEDFGEYLKPGTAVNRISWLGEIAL